jgi:hypothetical protein
MADNNQQDKDPDWKKHIIFNALVSSYEETEKRMQEYNRSSYDENASNDVITSNIISNGVEYNPAWKHYGKEVRVICDRCGKQRIDVCIGWDKHDLCLECVQQIKDKLINS